MPLCSVDSQCRLLPSQLALSASYSLCKLQENSKRAQPKRVGPTVVAPINSSAKSAPSAVVTPDTATVTPTTTLIETQKQTQTLSCIDDVPDVDELELRRPLLLRDIASTDLPCSLPVRSYADVLLCGSSSSSSSSSSSVSTTLWLLLRQKVIDPLFSSSRLRSILLLNLLTFLYGSNIPIIKETEATSDPSIFLVGRFALAAIVFSPFLSSGIKNSEVRNASVELGFWISMGYETQSLSLLTCDAGRASFISAFTVIAVPLLAGFSGREISKITWASAITAFIGVGFLETSGSPATVGDLWSLFSALLFGIHMLRTEHYSRTLSGKQLLPLLSMQLSVITLCSIFYFAVDMALKGSLPDFQGSLPDFQDIDLNAISQSMSGLPWLPMMYTGVVSTALCLWIELTAMRDVSATDAAVIYSLEPLWGAAFAWSFLGERWGLKGWFGALLILGGSLAVQLFQAQNGANDCTDEEKPS